MNAPLYNALVNYSKKNIYPFFTPGHKMGNILPSEDLLKIDLTELNETDNLYEPTGVIKQAQALAAKTFGAKHSFFLINGSSCGIEAAIYALCKPNDMIIVARNCHVSVYNGIILSQAKPLFVYPDISDYGICGQIKAADIDNLMQENKNAKIVIITSPTYEGILTDIEEISSVVHKHAGILIVDEAHGAHFKFSSLFPKTALEMGADVVIQSTHKTLPALTGTSLMHIRESDMIKQKIEKSLKFFQTTSPSYIKMGLLDYLRAILDINADKLFASYTKNLVALRNCFSDNKTLILMDSQNSDNTFYDISKIVFWHNQSPDNSAKIQEIFVNQYKIQPESVMLNHVIFMTSIADSNEGYQRLKEAVFYIESLNLEGFSENRAVGFDNYPNKCVHPVVSMHDAFHSERESVHYKSSCERISADMIVPYPPGIPLIAPGEIITSEAVLLISEYNKRGLSVTGVIDNWVNVLKPDC